MFYTKFLSPRPIFYLPGSKCTRMGERASICFPHCYHKENVPYSKPQWYIPFLTGLDIKHLAYMPVGHVVLKIHMPCKKFYVPSQYLYKPCKAYVYCWENKYMPRLKNHLPSQAHNHKSLGALGQNLRALSMRARLNVSLIFLFRRDFVLE